MSDNTNETAQHFRGNIPAALLTAVIILSGCGKAEEAVVYKLPSVTEYSLEASSVREAQTERESEPEESLLFSDSETVSAGSAAGKQTEIVTSCETAPSQTEASEETSSETASETEEVPKETTAPPASETTTTETAPNVSETEESVSESSEIPETMQLETECSVPAAPAPASDTDYDSEFFSSDLFIGDSISTGYSLYGFLSEKNVFAKVGLNPSTVLTKTVSTCYGDIGISDMLACTEPRRVYIMLGSNGIQWLSVGNMLQSTNTLVDLIKEACPGCNVVIISVPPVTAAYDSTVEDVNVMGKINEYNSSLSAYCTANQMLFVDAASILKDETGYFNSTYAESDGMHFKSSAYKTLLSKIQSDVTEFEEANAAETEAPTEETVSETSEAESEESTAETEKQSEALPETFVTLPKQSEKTNENE